MDVNMVVLLIISIGLAVDFSAHIGYTFMTVSGTKNGTLSLHGNRSVFLSHLLIAGCDIGVQISNRPFVRAFFRPSTFTSKFGFLYINDS